MIRPEHRNEHRALRLICAALLALALLAAGASALIATNATTAAPNATASPTATVPPPVATTVAGGALDVLGGPGNTVFRGEEGLDITAAGVAAGDTLGWFEPGSDVLASAPDATIAVSNPADFYVAPGTRTGPWYNINRNRTAAITVQDPSLALRVWDVQANQDVTGRSVVRGRLLSFRIDSNLDAVAAQRGVPAPVTVRVQAPGGNVYAALVDDTGGLNPIVAVPVTSSSFVVPGNGTGGAVWDTANANYPAGDYRVWAEADLNRMKDNYRDPSGADYTGRTISSLSTITFGRDELSIEATTSANISRTQDVAVLITGRPNTDYVVWVQGTSALSGAEQPPRIKPGQVGVVPGDPAAGAFVFSGGRNVAGDVPATAGANPWYARVTTDASGRRTVGLGTDLNTSARDYTIRVDALDTAGGTRSDTVSVSVATGRVTITAGANESVYLGEEIRLSGTNTASETTHLLFTGPNLPSGGVRLADAAAVATGDAGTFTTATVGADDRWEYRWSTAGLNLDAGAYTVYAVSAPNGADRLGGTQFATASVVVRRPFVVANITAPTVARGDELTIRGTAEGRPSQGVAIWLFGANFYNRTTASIADDGTFSYDLSRGVTRSLSTGQYFAVVQHPMTNGLLDVTETTSGGVTRVSSASGAGFVAAGPGRLQGAEAANALTDLLEATTIDDTYTRLTFTVEQPSIAINVSDIRPGDNLTVAGTTNLAPGNDLLITVTSSAFEPTNKTDAGGFSGLSGQTEVQAGVGGRNTFTYTAATSGLAQDTYQVVVEAVEASVTESATFRVTDQPSTVTPGATATPAGNATPGVTGTAAVTGTPAGNATATPTPTPGFGTLVALAGLAGVGLLVRRRG